MHPVPDGCLRIIEALAGADDIGIDESSEEHRDAGLPDRAVAAEGFEACEAVLAVVEDDAELAADGQLLATD